MSPHLSVQASSRSCARIIRGSLTIFVADDDSSDDTAAIAARTAAMARERQVNVIRGRGPARGWTGKLWALKEGIAAAERSRPDYLLLTDADIVHTPDTVAWLVAHSLAGKYVLVSLMAKLRCASPAERSHVPAFIYFFQMLFPFSLVNRTRSGVAAAAGGCILVHRDSLERAGGISGIRNALIDDCSLAAKMKAVGPIWLGLTERVQSIRPYETLSDVSQMISRSAYAQLRYSPLLLAATTMGLLLTFVAPPMLAIFAAGLPRYLGLAAWLAMALSFVPFCDFTGCRHCGAWLCRELHRFICTTRSIPPINTSAAAGANGRGAFMMRRACNDQQRSTSVRQGREGRKLPRCIMADQEAASAGHTRVL